MKEQEITKEIPKEFFKKTAGIESLVGNAYFFRTVTYFIYGRVVEKLDNFYKLENATWVANAGKFDECLKTGKAEESEYVGEAFVNSDSVTDFFPWKHDLETK